MRDLLKLPYQIQNVPRGMCTGYEFELMNIFEVIFVDWMSHLHG